MGFKMAKSKILEHNGPFLAMANEGIQTFWVARLSKVSQYETSERE